MDAVEIAERDATNQYVDDLEAANRFKTFLLGLGVEVPAEVIEGLAKLTNALATPKAQSVMAAAVPATAAAAPMATSYTTHTGAVPPASAT